jgi:hypothetical protein
MKTLSLALLALIVTLPLKAFGELSGYETHVDKEGWEYTRFPPGSHYMRSHYRWSLVLPEGVEGCTDGGVLGSHGLTLGESSGECLVERVHPAATIHSFWRDPVDFGGFSNLLRDSCKDSRVTRSRFVIDGRRFRRCPVNDREVGRYVSYFAYRPGEVIYVNIFCPATGSCQAIEKKWTKLLFPSLHLDWLNTNK